MYVEKCAPPSASSCRRVRLASAILSLNHGTCGQLLPDSNVGAHISRRVLTVQYSVRQQGIEANVDNAMSSRNAALWILVYFRYMIYFRNARLNLVDNGVDPEVIGEKR